MKKHHIMRIDKGDKIVFYELISRIHESGNILTSSANPFLIASQFGEHYSIQRNEYSPVINIVFIDDLDDEIQTIINIKNEDPRNSNRIISNEIHLVENRIIDNYYPFRYIKNRDIKVDELDSFDSDMTSYIKIAENKISLLKDMFIQNMSDEYSKKSRRLKAKENAFKDILSMNYSYDYCSRLLKKLRVINNIILKDEELLLFLDSYFFSDAIQVINGNVYFSNGNKENRQAIFFTRKI